MAPTTHTVAIIEAVEDKAMVLLTVDHQDVEVTMVTMVAMEMETSPREITKCKTVPNQPAGTATSMDIAKKTAVNASGRMLLQRSQWNDLLAKTKSITCGRRR